MCDRLYFGLLKTDAIFPSKVSRETSPLVLDRFSAYLDMLDRWTKRVDLVAPASKEVLAVRHIIDSLAAWMLIKTHFSLPAEQAFLDVGTGAGLPGVIFAILKADSKILLCEPRQRRVSFLREVRRELELDNIDILAERLEQVSSEGLPAVGLTITRALGRRPLFLEHSARLLAQGGYALEMAGPNLGNIPEVFPAKGEGPKLKKIKEIRYLLPPEDYSRTIIAWKL